jgi:hypothetical protein
MRPYVALLPLLAWWGLLTAQGVRSTPVVLLPSTFYSGLNSDISVHDATEPMTIALRKTATSADIVTVTSSATTVPGIESLAVPAGLEAGAYVISVSTVQGVPVSTADVNVEATDYYLVRKSEHERPPVCFVFHLFGCTRILYSFCLQDFERHPVGVVSLLGVI